MENPVLTIILSLVSAVIGALMTIKSQEKIAKKQLKDSLDSKSEWRKKLYDTASKADIDLNDIYRLRASLRYKPNNSAIDIKVDSCENYFTFANMTYKMIKHCDDMVRDYSGGTNSKKLNTKDAEITRIYLRYLLKNQWEILSNEGKELEKYKANEKHIIKETLEMLDNI